MFQQYDCKLDALARGAIPVDCGTELTPDCISSEYSINYAVVENVQTVTNIGDEFLKALKVWIARKVAGTLNEEVIYNSERMAPFARVFKTKHTECKEKSGQPPAAYGLCSIPLDKIPTPSPDVSTSLSPENTSQPSQGSEAMTPARRESVVNIHNNYRSALARGRVRNGKEGNVNCPTATNMYQMRYDMAMEAEAQAYADSCPDSNSAVSSRSGLLTYRISSITLPYDDAITLALKTWWEQILKNGVNNQMKYNQFLEEKPEAPTAFTQMAWAESYKVGCGIKRRSFGTVVACRYNPRGNIYTQFIYRPGNTCASCSFTCQDALCPAPAN
ncbi:hypothetical protein Y032_0010g1025 [Ancylostoma ceylanicum]|nr:hypothetical protein Y032_0010g1025 [Ancylostoma ceylanicum]